MYILELTANLIRFLVKVTFPFSDTILDMISLIFMGRTRALPPIENRILLMSATELAQKIRKRQISSEKVVRAYVERSKAIHPMINAVVDERYEEAIKEAIEVDRFLASNRKTEEEIATEYPLLGLPFTVKEAVGVKGLAQTAGVVAAKDRKAQEDGEATKLYRNAGAIPLTVTNVPELLFWWDSTNQIFGMTRNPYDNRRTVGGSSGGEGAIITSAGALFGIGTDIAGSIRVPSSFNGIYGHKPSKDIISNKGVFPYKPGLRTYELLSTGPMCRYAEDLPLLFGVLAKNYKNVQMDKRVNFRKLTVYYMEGMPGYLSSAVPVVKDAIRKAVKHFEESYGIKAIELKIDELKLAGEIFECKLLEYGSPPFKSVLAGEGNTINLFCEFIKKMFGHSTHTLPALFFALMDRHKKDSFYDKCLQKYEVIVRRFNEILQDKEAVLLIPTHPEPPPHYLMTIPKYRNLKYTCIFNLLGFPSTNIPAGLSDRGLPFGIQAVSGKFHDHISIATALELDRVFNGWNSPCPIID